MEFSSHEQVKAVTVKVSLFYLSRCGRVWLIDINRFSEQVYGYSRHIYAYISIFQCRKRGQRESVKYFIIIIKLNTHICTLVFSDAAEKGAIDTRKRTLISSLSYVLKVAQLWTGLRFYQEQITLKPTKRVYDTDTRCSSIILRMVAAKFNQKTD